jgi:tRNA-dihydrouridine synthase B
MFCIGPYSLKNQLLLAPMAGVTDRPFRSLCKRLGAGYAVGEMQSAKPELRNTLKSSRRADHQGESGPIAVQILGTEPLMMAEAAGYNIERGAQIIDINMGCPAKKVCSTWAGSALMRNEPLAIAIAEAVVRACEPYGVPVTLKMRTGWSQSGKNAPQLAQRFAEAGVQMLAIHGRTREQGYSGQAEYLTIAEIKARVNIPVVANGDIDSPHKAAEVLVATGADGLMIGRAAQGRPWVFRDIHGYLNSGTIPVAPLVTEVRQWLLGHLQDHYEFYGEFMGVRTARKHIGWYLQRLPDGQALRKAINGLDSSAQQLALLNGFFDQLASRMERLPVE